MGSVLRSTLLCFLLAPALAYGQKWYEIEILIFKHNSLQNGPEQDAEVWPKTINLTWPAPLISLESGDQSKEHAVFASQPEEDQTPDINTQPAAIPYEELSRSKRRLNNDAYALRVNSNYRVLWHKAWQAPLTNESQSPWLLVESEENINSQPFLQGAIKIHLSRYLHLHTNLWWTVFADKNTSIETISVNTPLPGSLGETVDQTQTDIASTASNDLLHFGWDQIPWRPPANWPCGYFYEYWPEDERVLPADYYDNPGPEDWYFPFGCQPQAIEEQDDKVLPAHIAVPTSYFETTQPESEHNIIYKDEPNAIPGLTENTDTSSTPFDLGEEDGPVPLSTITFQPVGPPESEGEPEAVVTEQTNRPDPDITHPIAEIVHIKQRRRMRSGELHYIDHPKVGILALITPIDIPDLKEIPVDSTD